MKNVHILFFLLVFSFISCTKDDTNEALEVTAANIKGKWNLTSVSCKDGKSSKEDLDRVFQLATFEVTGEDINASVEMTENPNSYIGRGTLTHVKKITPGGLMQTLDFTVVDFAEWGAWRLENNKLIVSTSEIETITFDIIKLNASTLEYKVNIREVVEDDDYKYVSTGTYFYTFTR